LERREQGAISKGEREMSREQLAMSKEQKEEGKYSEFYHAKTRRREDAKGGGRGSTNYANGRE